MKRFFTLFLLLFILMSMGCATTRKADIKSKNGKEIIEMQQTDNEEDSGFDVDDDIDHEEEDDEDDEESTMPSY